MNSVLRRIFAAPVLDTEEATLHARMLYRVVWATVGAVALFMGFLVILEPDTLVRRAGSALFVAVLGMVVVELSRQGRARQASWLLVIGLVAVLSWRAFTAGGVSAPQTNGFVILVLLAGALLGMASGLVVAVACIAISFAFLWAQARGALPPSELVFTPLATALYGVLWISLAIVLQYQVAWGLRHALRRAEAELREREQAQARLEQSYAELQESEDKFSRVFASVPAGLALSRVADGRFLDVNDEFVRLYGWPREEVIGRTSHELNMWVDPAERDRLVADLVAGSGEQRDVELRLRGRDGREHVMRTSTQVLEIEGEDVMVSAFIDVTERRRAEEALRVSERRFGTIFRESPVALTVSEADTGRLVEVNQALLRLVGAKSFEEVLGKSLVELGVLSPDVRSRIREHAVGGKSGTFVAPAKRLNGEEYVGEASMSSYEIDGKRYVLAGTIDITERLRAEQERLNAERQYRELVEGVRDVVFSLSPDGRITTLNPAFESMTGMRAEDWIGKLYLDLIHPEDAARAREEMTSALTTGPVDTAPLRVRRVDGRYVFVEINVAPRREEGRVVSVTGIGRDVSERVALEFARAQAELEREASLYQLGERVKELRLLHQTSGLLQRPPPTLGDLLREWIVLVPVAWRFPEVCEARISYLDVVVSTAGWRNSRWRMSADFTTSDGAGVLEVVYLEEMPPADEGPFLAEERALLDSLTEMLVGYFELRRHREGLEELVGLRTRELGAAKDEADRANRAKSTFLATMSHEIRTPMNAILGYTQMLWRDRSLDEAQRRKVHVILTSGDHLLTLINNVLEMSRIEAGRTSLTLQPVDIRALLDGVAQMFSAVAATKGLELTLEAASGLPLAVRADAGKVRQVLINMVGNAMKFTERGEVTIRASSTRRGNGYLIAVAVQDTGPGIAAEDLPRVFGAFEQLGLGVRIGGTGLGLAISREFAHLMGGDLSVNSSAGVGSTFTFTFAVEEASSHELVRTESKALPVGITKDRPVPKILVVDDQFAGREVAREVLAGIGFDARVAASGEEAIQIHDSWRPDLVLMDLRMPGIGGLEAMRRLRAAGSKTVLVAFTASSIEEAPRESRAAGADDILLKPYREADLFRILGERLDVEYVYEPSEGPAPLAVVLTSDPSALSESLRNMPADLLDSLRTAALQARARRIEELVVDVAAYSSEAAGQIRALARDFRYDDLVTALDEATQRSIESLPPRGV